MPFKFTKTLLTKRVTRSIESLHHFQCGACKKWFSISEAPSNRTRWYCPWCGLYQQFDGDTHE